MDADVRSKRIYDDFSDEDGYRVLIDRLWPRGISKERARLAEWARELAPSPELRRWFGHDPSRFAEFRRRYRDELADHAAKVEELRGRARREPVTLLYAARDREHNDAVVLVELLQS